MLCHACFWGASFFTALHSTTFASNSNSVQMVIFFTAARVCLSTPPNWQDKFFLVFFAQLMPKSAFANFEAGKAKSPCQSPMLGNVILSSDLVPARVGRRTLMLTLLYSPPQSRNPTGPPCQFPRMEWDGASYSAVLRLNLDKIHPNVHLR